MKRNLLFLTLLLIALAACVPSPNTAVYQPQTINCNIPQGSSPEAVATLTTRCQQDAQGTIQAQAAATRQSVEATGQAVQVATAQARAVIQSTAVAVTSTTESLQFRATEQALAFQQSDATATALAQQMWLSATGTAVAVQASVLATAESQRAYNVEMVQRDTAQMLANQRAREAFWNAAWPWIVGVLLTLIATAVSAGIYFMYRNKRPIMQVMITGGNGQNITVPLIRDERGGFRVLPGTLPHEGGRLALPAPETAVQPVPLPKLDIGHLLIAGPTGAGKSTAMRALLAHRGQAVVLDPHAGPNDWAGKHVLGSGRNFAEIQTYMEWMLGELDRRAEQRARGVQSFEPLTVATDEMPSIADELGREVYTIWQKWVREGRKFGLYFIVSTQSTRVKTLGIEGEGDVLKNFAAVLYLGQEAVDQYPDLVDGMSRPAILRTLRGPQPVVIPHIPTGVGAPPPPPPTINLPRPTSQAEQDGRKLNGRIREFNSLNAVGMALGDFSEQPSGQFLQERVYPALEWRARSLECPDAARLLNRRRG
jgi:hypothetical protein